MPKNGTSLYTVYQKNPPFIFGITQSKVNRFRILFTKICWKRLIFDRVIQQIKTGTFWGTLYRLYSLGLDSGVSLGLRVKDRFFFGGGLSLTPNLYLKVRIFLNIKSRKWNGMYSHTYNGRPIGSRVWPVEWCITQRRIGIGTVLKTSQIHSTVSTRVWLTDWQTEMP